MESTSWLSLLIQVPLVGVFIWYSLEMNKRSNETQKTFMDALDKRDEAFDKRNNAIIQVIERMNESICAQLKDLAEQHDAHDRYVHDNIAKTRAK
jgi:uncharacterized Zn finger protein